VMRLNVIVYRILLTVKMNLKTGSGELCKNLKQTRSMQDIDARTCQFWCL